MAAGDHSGRQLDKCLRLGCSPQLGAQGGYLLESIGVCTKQNKRSEQLEKRKWACAAARHRVRSGEVLLLLLPWDGPRWPTIATNPTAASSVVWGMTLTAPLCKNSHEGWLASALRLKQDVDVSAVQKGQCNYTWESRDTGLFWGDVEQNEVSILNGSACFVSRHVDNIMGFFFR